MCRCWRPSDILSLSAPTYPVRLLMRSMRRTPICARSPSSFCRVERLFLLRVNLHQPIQEFAALEQGLDPDVLVEAMNIAEIRSEEHRFHAESRDARRVREFAVCRTSLQN